eukprot:760840-Hanusia_phi.AAC.1
MTEPRRLPLAPHRGPRVTWPGRRSGGSSRIARAGGPARPWVTTPLRHTMIRHESHHFGPFLPPTAPARPRTSDRDAPSGWPPAPRVPRAAA